MEGFPHHPDEVQYLLEKQLFPDVVVTMAVDVTDVQKRLFPKFLESWRERRNHRDAQLGLLRDLRKKNRVSERQLRRISTRRTFLSALFCIVYRLRVGIWHK